MEKLQQLYPFLNKQFSNEFTQYLEGTIHGRRIIVSTQGDESRQWILTDNNRYVAVAANVATQIPDEITSALTKILNNQPVEPNQTAKILQNLLG